MSLELCDAYREAHAVHLRVDSDIPITLVAAADVPHANAKGCLSSRVPRLRARRLTWEIFEYPLDLLSILVETLAEVEELYFHDGFSSSLDVQAWPSRLRKLEFSEISYFNRPIVDVAWPSSLQELSLQGEFDQPIKHLTWSTCLRKLALGTHLSNKSKASRGRRRSNSSSLGVDSICRSMASHGHRLLSS